MKIARSLSSAVLSSAVFLAVAALGSAAATPALADDNIELVLKDHKFTPDRVEVHQGVKIVITVKNQDSSADEFDSRDLKREKVIPGGKEGVVLVGPLAAGEYHFQGEYHANTAQGVLVVK